MIPALVLALSLTPSQIAAELQWRNIGPAITGGRIDAIAVDPSHPDTVYVGAATGGLWKTVNGGTTWTPVFDDFGTTSIGDVAVSRSNPNAIWVGTGEANNRQSSSWGNGVYKSSDGGRTWQHVGLADTRHIGRIVIHPTDPDIVYVAAMGHLWGPNRERGLFKTTDGGKTWTNTKFIDENTGFVDVAMDPRDPNTLYAAAYQRQRKAYGFNGGGPGSGLYRTTDGAKTWTRLEDGLPSGNVGRIGIDVYRRNPNVVYVSYEHKEGGIFRSDDRGKSWKKMSGLQPRPLYFSQIRIDPQDDRRVYMLATSLFVSDDGGKTFRTDGARNVHVDHHAMWIDPQNPSSIWLGNDGGVWTSRDRAVTWNRINNIPLAQVYVVGADMRDPYWVYGGLQDNGVWSGPSATRNRVGPLNDDWLQVGGGDGMFVAASPNDPRTAYVEMQDGRILRFDTASGENKAIRPFVRPPQEPTPARTPADSSTNDAAGAQQDQEGASGGSGSRFNWTTPIVVSPHNPLIVYLAGHQLWRSLDRGEHWTAISPDLSRHINRDKIAIMGVLPSETMLGRNDGITSYGTATAMSESPKKAGLLLVGTDDGLVQMSADGGARWEDVTSRMPGAPEGAWVSAISLSAVDPDRMFVAFDNHRNDDYRAYLYRSDDGGKTWQAQTDGLAETAVRSVREDPFNGDVVFAGTERGLYWSATRGRTWEPLKNGLPDVPVFDVQVQARDRDLVIATHGRGVYIMNIAPLEAWNSKIASEPVHLFEPRASLAFNFLEHRDFLGQATYVGGNPPRAAVIYYSILEPTGDATLRVIDPDGETVRTLPVNSTPGVHRVEWDLRLEPPPQPVRARPADGVLPDDPRPAESTRARIPGDFGGGGDPTGGEAGGPPDPLRGPAVRPGRYRAIVTAGTHSAETFLRIEGDARIRISQEEIDARWSFLKRIYDVQRRAVPIANGALELRDQSAATSKALDSLKDAPAELKTFVADASKKAREAQTRLGRIMGQLGTASRDVSGSTSRPTNAQEEQLGAALAALDSALERATDVSKQGPEVNRRLDAAAIPKAVPRINVAPTKSGTQ